MTLLRRSIRLFSGTALAASLLSCSFSLHAAEATAEVKPDVESKEGAKDDYYELMRVFVDTFQEIDQNYVKEVDRRKLVEAAVRGMLEELDPYSDYIGPDDLGEFTEAISQEFGGVGIRVNWDRQARAIEVVTPMPGSPAYKAGIKAGDRVVEIAGKLVKDFPNGKEIDTAVEMLRGKPGETVELGVVHPTSNAVDSKEPPVADIKPAGTPSDATETPKSETPKPSAAPEKVASASPSKEIQRVTLTRELIQLETVLGYSHNKDNGWEMMLDPQNKIGYFRLTHFTGRSASEVREALKSLKKEGMKGLIIDLRFNPGGLLEAAVEISDMFVEKGLIVSTDGRSSAHRSWSAKSFGTFTGFPIAILVNRYSASASEIVSACLQDHDRAIVIGERSWGKGSVQDVIDLEGGKAALKLTTASYHRPSGKNIHRFPDSKEGDEWGVMPNEGYKIDYTMDDWRKFQEDRQQRDMVGHTPKAGYVDRHLEAAKEYLLKKMKEEPAAAVKPEGDQKDEKPAEPKPTEKKATSFRLPLIAVPKQNAG